MPPPPPRNDRRTHDAIAWSPRGRGVPESFDYEAAAETVVDDEELSVIAAERTYVPPRNAAPSESIEGPRRRRRRNAC